MKKINIYLVIIALLISILAVQTGLTGGAIRHTEIKKGFYKNNKL